MTLRRLCTIAGIAAATAGVAPAAANGADWPRRLFVLTRTSDEQTDAVQDFVARPDGYILVASGSTDSFAGHVRRLSPAGRLRPVATFRRAGGRSGIGILADGRQAFLVADGESSRVWRVSASGAKQVVAGAGEEGFRGDGGPARRARLHFGASDHAGLARQADGSLVVTDPWNNRLRRIAPDGTITTFAGSGPSITADVSCAPFGGDGGPATWATLCRPADVLATADGATLVTDDLGYVRRIAPDGTITTIAGDGSGRSPSPADDGKPATEVPLAGPEGLAQLPGGDLLISDFGRISRLTADGRLHTFLRFYGFEDRPMTDFAGRQVRYGPTGLEVTAEGGVLIAAADAYYLAPRHSRRTLVRIHGARVRRGKVTLDVEGTRRARATTTVSRGGRTVARSTRTIRGGRRSLAVRGAFAARPYRVDVSVSGPHGATAADAVALYLGTRLRKPYVRRLAGEVEDESVPDRCHRFDRLRVDCSYEDDEGCDHVTAFTRRRTGVIWMRLYGCADPEHPFLRDPEWSGAPSPLGAPEV